MINLPDDDPVVVREMVCYLYNLDLVGYEFIPEDGNFIEEELSDTEYDDATIRRMEWTLTGTLLYRVITLVFPCVLSLVD